MGDVARWLAEARSGSGEALGQALEACRTYLYLIAQRELDPGLRVKGSASDLVQETFVEAQRDFGQFHGTSDEEWRAWLRRLLLNNIANFTRRYRTEKRHLGREVALDPDGSSAERGGGLATKLPSPSGAALEHEQAECLRQALARLPEDYRQVIVLRYEENLPFEEVARRMGRSAAAARTLWSRAIRRLRHEMEKPS